MQTQCFLISLLNSFNELLFKNNSVKNINSPCVRNCCLNEDDVCLGCFRNLEEICAWATATEQQKQIILDTSKLRKSDYKNKAF